MNRAELIEQIRAKSSFLCIGLDTDIQRIPLHLLGEEDPVFEFNKAIIDATHDLCVAYKPNVAFYECLGPRGWHSLKLTIEYIQEVVPEPIFTIVDCKRGDIGNTSRKYAETYFRYLDVDSVTISPYMGEDTVSHFLNFNDRWVVVLGLTSNEGSQDFQFLELADGSPLYQTVIKKASQWGNKGDTMFVVGATHPEYFAEIRNIIPDHFLLVPGIGAQGGSLSEVCKYGLNSDIGLLVNSSRGIIYAGDGEDYALQARMAAMSVQNEMKEILGNWS